MQGSTHLSVIIPAFNEEKRLSKTLEAIDLYLKKQNYAYEIIVVNDGSKDKTSEITNGLMGNIRNLKLIDNRENRGKGAVVRQGMLGSGGDYRVFTDADNSTPIDQIEKMWPYFKQGCDVVIGSRDLPESVLAIRQPWFRKLILGGGFKLFRKMTVGLWEIHDTQCGFKVFTKDSAENIFRKTKIDRFAFDSEVLIIAKKLGYGIKEVGVTWLNDPESRVKFKSVIKMGFDLIKLRLNLIKGAYDF
ncbi:MAG: glycosyltransferase family 2 protein [Candidatus Nealsonbacteria bacterium]|nr:glycosyltransferase family 2 protein [Candidatus Nealsonbacteria bacterium]